MGTGAGGNEDATAATRMGAGGGGTGWFFGGGAISIAGAARGCQCGTTMSRWQAGHWIFRPAYSSPTSRCWPHWGQPNLWVLMAGGVEGQKEKNFNTCISCLKRIWIWLR